MFFFVFLLGSIALVSQMFLPHLTEMLAIRPAPLPLVIIYGALAMNGLSIFGITVILGLMLDLLSPQTPGLSILSLSLLAWLMTSQRIFFRVDRWDIQILLALIGTFFYLIVDYLLYSAQLHQWLWPFSLWTKMVFSSMLNALVSPLFFWLTNRLTRLLGIIKETPFPDRLCL